MAETTLVTAFREQYKKTFVGIQITIGVVTVAVLVQSHRLLAALSFWGVMQAGAVLGALWALSLKSRIARARSLRA